MTRPPSGHLSGQDESGFGGISLDTINPVASSNPKASLYHSIYHVLHQKHHKAPKAPAVHKVHKAHVPVPKKPHVVHPPKPKPPKKPHVVHVAKAKPPKKPHAAKAAPAPKAPHVAKAHLGTVRIKSHPGPALRGGLTNTGVPRDQINADGSITRLNKDGTKGPGKISKHSGPNPYSWRNHPGAITIDSHGHRSSAAGAAATAAHDSGQAARGRHGGAGGGQPPTPMGSGQDGGRRSGGPSAPSAPPTTSHKGSSGGARAPHAPHTPHAPTAHKTPKPPLQINTDSFLGSDSHVESHRPTPLAPATQHRMPKPHYR